MLRLARPLVAVSALERLTHMDGADTAVVASNIEVDEQVQGTVRIIEERPGFLRAEVASSGRVLCVFKQRLFPGWRADTERGQLQVIPVDGDFIGFVVPGGRNQVTLHFDPADFRIGMNLTLLASAVLIAGAVAVSAKRAWQ